MNSKHMILFEAITTREKAVEMAQYCGQQFYILAGILAAIGFFIAPTLIIDAALYAICGYFIRNKLSRVAAAAVLVLCLAASVATVKNNFRQQKNGGTNIVLAIIAIGMSIRSLEATIKAKRLAVNQGSAGTPGAAGAPN